jgi:epoxyqueuosine reductase
LLGEIITNIKLQTDEPICHYSERSEESIGSAAGSCLNCNKCINACPTGALRADGQLDASKCISYLTIEHKDRIPFDLTGRIGDWLFGCDECILACPYQQNAPACTNKQFKFYNDKARLNLRDVLDLSQTDFEARFADSCINRLGLERLKRNAKICLANVISRKYSPE